MPSTGLQTPRQTRASPPEHAEALYQTVRRLAPNLAIEVGMAQGVQTLSTLMALRDSGKGGRLLSIDPFQSTQWHNVGLKRVGRAGFSSSHTLIEEPDWLALPRLAQDRTRIGFGYVDGWHTFDYTLLDFFYVDKMLLPGGVVGFNDCGLRSVRKVLRFAQTHRKYSEMAVGLRRSYAASNPVKALVRLVLGWRTEDRYFRKESEWEPDWSYFRPF